MKRVTRLIGLIIAAYLMTTPAVAAGTQGVRALDARGAIKVRVVENYGTLPLSFEANQGQTGGGTVCFAWGP